MKNIFHISSVFAPLRRHSAKRGIFAEKHAPKLRNLLLFFGFYFIMKETKKEAMLMIAPRPISPLLDGYTLSEPTCARDGVVCAEAVENVSGAKFVLKMISVPASAVQMDALLMTGAFPDRDRANAYYKERARAVLNEAKTLRHLATLGYFSDFDCVQVVPAAHANGYEIYLLSAKQTSLRQRIRRGELTHLQVLNMALDVCAALSTCRHTGYFYANLKPENIFHTGGHDRIGDLGIVPLSSVGRAPVPESYRSAYTPPEQRTGRACLDDTADVYALGMILYEAYNGGILPGDGDVVGRLLAPPRYADYEMAEIILRACAPEPAIRWHDPQQMQQALSRYLQRNGMHDTPIIPKTLRQAQDELPLFHAHAPEPFLPEPEDSEPLAEETPAPVRRERTHERAPRVMRKVNPGVLLVAALAVLLVIELIIGGIALLRSDRIDIDAFRVTSADAHSVTVTLEYAHDAPAGWVITCQAEGEQPRSFYFTGKIAELTDLTPDVAYTLTLRAQDDRHLSGQTEITYTLPPQ